MPKHPSRPRDINQNAKMIMELATGEKMEPTLNGHTNPKLVARARSGGLKGGKARAKRLTPAERKEIAQKAAKKRWNK
jgi:hypothetical protein